MSNRTSRLNALTDAMRRLGLAPRPARVPTTVEVVSVDFSSTQATVEQLEAMLVSDLATANVRRAQELANFAREPFGVYEDRAGYSIVVVVSDAPPADRWTLVARCEPRTL